MRLGKAEHGCLLIVQEKKNYFGKTLCLFPEHMRALEDSEIEAVEHEELPVMIR